MLLLCAATELCLQQLVRTPDKILTRNLIYARRECETYARHMTKTDPKDGSILNFNSPEEQEAVEVVFNNAITPLAEVGLLSAGP